MSIEPGPTALSRILCGAKAKAAAFVSWHDTSLRRAISGDGRNGDLCIDGGHIHDRTLDASCDHRFCGALRGKETAGQIDVQDFLEIGMRDFKEIGRQCSAGVVNENRHIANV